MKISIANRQKKTKLPLKQIKRDCISALKALNVTGAELSLVFASSVAVKKLNTQYRGKDTTTDVLSFPLHEFMGRPSLFKGAALKAKQEGMDFLLGDIVIDPIVAQRQAKEFNHDLSQEIRRLIVHGLLHLVGYDHETTPYERRKMSKAENNLMQSIS